jgi:hypothetical protein
MDDGGESKAEKQDPDTCKEEEEVKEAGAEIPDADDEKASQAPRKYACFLCHCEDRSVRPACACMHAGTAQLDMPILAMEKKTSTSRLTPFTDLLGTCLQARKAVRLKGQAPSHPEVAEFCADAARS